jgi:hypothetical protein
MCTHTMGGSEPLIRVRSLDLAGRNVSANDLQIEPAIVQDTELYWFEFDLPSCLLVFDTWLPQTHYHRYDALVREVEGWVYWCLEAPGTCLFPYRRLFIVWYGPANGCRTISTVCDYCWSF